MHKKKDFKIKFIFPCMLAANDRGSRIPFYYLPYGMGILTSFLRQSNYYVEQEDLSIRFNRHHPPLFSRYRNKDMDFNTNKIQIDKFFETGEIGSELGLLINKILDATSLEGFDTIGISVHSHHFFLVSLLFSKVIKQRTNVPIVFGGPFITLYGHLYPEAFKYIDYMIVGDGRIPMLKLIGYLNNKITISEVPNLIHKKDGGITINPKEYYPIEDIPLPDFSGLPMQLYENRHSDFSGYDIQLPYQISNGCTNKCSFCIHKNFYNKLEFKSYEKVIKELRYMKQRYQSKIFCFSDSSINNSYEYLEKLCDLFIKNKLDIKWNACAKVGNLDKYILRKMKEAGCHWLMFGIESGSDRMLEMMNKGFTSAQASKTLREASGAGLKNIIFVITGYPYETQKDSNQTSDFIRKNRKYIYDASVFAFELLYNSEMYVDPGRYSLVNLAPTRLRYCFSFDEYNGLKWEEKQKQKLKSQIIKTVDRYIRIKNFLFILRRSLGFIPVKIKSTYNLFNSLLIQRHPSSFLPYIYRINKNDRRKIK